MKTFTEILNSLIALLTTALPNRLDTRVGTVLRDALLAPVASVIADIYTSLSTAINDQSVSTYTSSAALDSIAANFGIYRSAGTYATGRVRFYVMRRPAVAIIVPFGTKVYASSGSPRIAFSTLTSVTITDITSAVFNQETDANSPFNGYYYAEAEVVCLTTGANGNVSAGSISSTDLQTVEGVDNPDATINGTDTLSDAQVASLITSTARGNIGTVYGYKSLVDGNFSFRDSVVIPFDDPEAVRIASGASVDVVVLSDSTAPVTESFPYAALITPTRQPLQRVTEVLINGDAQIEGVGYMVNFDESSSFAGSSSTRTTISILGAHVPTDVVQIKYQYNPDASSVQLFFDLPTNKVIGSDVMAKVALKVNVGIKADIVALPGYSLDVLLVSVRSAISELFSGLLLGEEIQKTDIINAIYDVPGVDYVDTATFELREKVGTDWQPNVEQVFALKREVVALSTDDSGNADVYLNEDAPWQ